jgi:HEAT repeat protein
MRFFLTGVLVLGIFAVTSAQGAEVRELITKLSDKDAEVRRAAAKDLAELGNEARVAVPDLIKRIQDRDTFVRRFSIEALGNIGADSKSALAKLTLAMNDERKEVGLSAVDAIGKIGVALGALDSEAKTASAAIQSLTSAVRDTSKDSGVRKKAAEWLGRIGSQARGAVPVLSDVLTGRIANGSLKGKAAKGKSNDDDIRLEVATALGSIAKSEDKAAIVALKSVAEGKQRNKQLQKAASDSLEKITGMPVEKKKKKK